MDLWSFLERKPLYYDKIDLTRMPRAYALVADTFKLGRVVHIVGTNGKGSTGRMLARMLQTLGKTGHYTSPHILRFHERIWIGGREIDEGRLQEAHRRLTERLPAAVAEELSYFEYTTLLALTAFEGCDYVVLEAGLGGEFDATSVVERELSVITPIGMDHAAFLGDTVEAIAETKLRSVQKAALLAEQTHRAVYEVADRILAQRGIPVRRVETVLSGKKKEAIRTLAQKAGWPPYMALNARTAAAAFEWLTDEEAPLEAALASDLPGRFERVADNVILDVGHNLPAAEAIAEALKGERRVLVYNALEDKDVEGVLARLAPVIERVEIIPIQSSRAVARGRIEAAARALGLKMGDFSGISPDESYLVFGSFTVAEAFLRRWRGA